MLRFLQLLIFLTTTSLVLSGQEPSPESSPASLVDLITEYRADLAALRRRYDQPMSQRLNARRQTLAEDYLKRLSGSDRGQLGRAAQIDWFLTENLLRQELRQLDHELRRVAEVRDLIGCDALLQLLEARRDLETVSPRAAAEILEATRRDLDGRDNDAISASPILRLRAGAYLSDMRRSLKAWFNYSAGYHPEFSWWCAEPFKSLDGRLGDYAKALTALPGDQSLVGDPIGKDALLDELRFELIPYSPEELVKIAEQEFAFCDAEMAKAAKELGFDDWRAAQKAVKEKHVAPGDQPALIRELALEAIDFVESRDLVTVPELCKEIWRVEMMSPARQRVSPYFLGGEVIQVAFPTDSMSHDDKLMSLRGNNRHFARATVHHELIPGHHLQGFMTERYRPYRQIFRTPFWVEGWALYWEMRLWDLDFASSAEDRIGMLFWRKHRCARIIFSLSFHLGTMSATDCVDYLVERVGHERNNAEAEVRRSIGGAYGPLYQAAYMLGGLQLRRLHQELVLSEKMTERAFHDAILQANAIPIAALRAELSGFDLDSTSWKDWRFYD